MSSVSYVQRYRCDLCGTEADGIAPTREHPFGAVPEDWIHLGLLAVAGDHTNMPADICAADAARSFRDVITTIGGAR